MSRFEFFGLVRVLRNKGLRTITKILGQPSFEGFPLGEFITKTRRIRQRDAHQVQFLVGAGDFPDHRPVHEGLNFLELIVSDRAP